MVEKVEKVEKVREGMEAKESDSDFLLHYLLCLPYLLYLPLSPHFTPYLSTRIAPIALPAAR